MKAFFAAIAMAAILCGCAGTPFKWDNARQIKDGMTEEEVVALMGSPYMVKTNPKGQLWVWTYADLYGISGGTRTLSLEMVDGKVVKAPDVPKAFK